MCPLSSHYLQWDVMVSKHVLVYLAYVSGLLLPQNCCLTSTDQQLFLESQCPLSLAWRVFQLSACPVPYGLSLSAHTLYPWERPSPTIASAVLCFQTACLVNFGWWTNSSSFLCLLQMSEVSFVWVRMFLLVFKTDENLEFAYLQWMHLLHIVAWRMWHWMLWGAVKYKNFVISKIW